MTTMPEYNDLAYSLAGVRRGNPFDRQRTMAQSMMKAGADASPVLHPLQGAARLAQALVGGWMGGQADRDEAKAGVDHENKIKEASSIADPAERMAALSALGGDAGLRATIASTGQELAKKRQRDEDMEASSFLLGTGSGPQQAGGGNRGGGGTSPAEWEPHFQTASQQHGIPVPLIKAVAGTESEFNAGAVSSAGAGGVMQIMPGTAKDLGVTDRFDPAQSITKGTAYLKQQLDKYGNLPHALAAYNWGPGNVDNWLKSGGDPSRLPAETQGYIQKVQARIGGGGAHLPQGSADGSGTPLPPQGGGDPGAHFEAAARRAHAGGRGDLSVKFMQQATAAREAAATRDQNRNMQHVDLGDSVGILDPRTGSIVQRIPKGQKPGAGEGGAFGGTGMENQARSALVRAAQDPRFAGSPEYAAAHSYLSRPRFDPGSQTTLPPEDLTRFPAPTYSAQGQPQAQPPQQAAAPPPGAPPAPSPSVVGGPAVVAQPPQPGIVATPVQGMPAKPMTGEQALAAGFTDRMANSNSLLAGLDGQGLSAWGSLNEKIPMAGNYRQTPEYRQYKQARDDFINAQLRRESGAAISDAEYDRANKQYFPQPGDDNGTIAQKAKNRALVVDAMRRNAGPGYTQNPAVGGAPSKKSAADIKKEWNLE